MQYACTGMHESMLGSLLVKALSAAAFCIAFSCRMRISSTLRETTCSQAYSFSGLIFCSISVHRFRRRSAHSYPTNKTKGQIGGSKFSYFFSLLSSPFVCPLLCFSLSTSFSYFLRFHSPIFSSNHSLPILLFSISSILFFFPSPSLFCLLFPFIYTIPFTHRLPLPHYPNSASASCLLSFLCILYPQFAPLIFSSVSFFSLNSINFPTHKRTPLKLTSSSLVS